MKQQVKQEPTQIKLVQLNASTQVAYVPQISNSKDWVLNGRNNSFYKMLINRYNGSPTNASILNSYVDMTYGKGLINLNGNVSDWLKFNKMLNQNEVKNIVTDYTIFGEAIMLVEKANSPRQLPTVTHLRKETTAPKKANDKNQIEGYYYCEDWAQSNKEEYTPIFLPILESDTKKANCFPIKPYKVGSVYFSNPEYVAGLAYAEMEEEIAVYYTSHIKNGLSFGYIINIPDGNSYTAEEKDALERQIKSKLTGANNAGRFIINFNGRDAEITVVAIEGNDAHAQWEYLTKEARQQLLTAHRVTSPMLFGIKDNTGLGNNADEMDTAEAQLMKRVIQPRQRYLIEAFTTLAEEWGLSLKLGFRPLTEPVSVDKKLSIDKKVNLSEQELTNLTETQKMLELLNALATEAPEGYEVYSCEDVVDEAEDFDFEKALNSEIQFADIKSSPTTKSSEDSPIFKVRYRYKKILPKSNQRDFCAQMHSISGQNKFFRKEDINFMSMKGVNNQFGHKGQNYSIFLYKGGVNCGDIWERVVFKKRNQKDGTPYIGNPLQNVTESSEVEAKLKPLNTVVTTPPYNMPNHGHHPNYNK